jgi:GWxTD domain-containing protein
MIRLASAVTLVLFFACSLFAQQAATQKPVAAADVYQRWVDEDVTYIITAEERAAYLQLTSSAERDHFIVQFWIRRDPTPDTPRNEFKEEHYRRIAYSNVQLADSLPGWKTDRGRVYIVEGQPESIDVVASSNVTVNARKVQIWRYKSGKQFRFLDSCACGEYRLVRPTLAN